MKIHMDYLEHKLEQYQSRDQTIVVEVEQLQNQLNMSNEKVSMIKDARAKDAKDATKKLDDLRRQTKTFQARIAELENQVV